MSDKRPEKHPEKYPEDTGLEDWLETSRARLARTALQPAAEAIGRVSHVADGIVQVTGLTEAPLGALLRFESGSSGFARSLAPDLIHAVLLDESASVEVGQKVYDTGEVLQVPVGEALLGRIIDPLGRPLDAGPVPKTSERLPIERPAPEIIERDLVAEPLETGVLLVDSLFAIGRGQRELLVGDHATGKTALAVDAIINQKSTDVITIYVAIGQRASAVERVVAAVRDHGAPERCIFVLGLASSPPGLQWIAPFAAMSMAEYFRDRGQDVLIVIDDLTLHAATHRELALLTREPPGREAYPGDIFYLHARLLERAAKLAPELGGGSITALPIAQTEAGNLSGYIPTNLISITDGQIVFDSHLFSADQRPAVDVGLSVSRVGGKAQAPGLRMVSGRVRLDYAQFLELEMFTRFGGISNPRVKAQIARGSRIRALLTQPRFSGLGMVDQVALLAALADGVLDDLAPEAIPELKRQLPGWLGARAPDALRELTEQKALNDALRDRLVAEVRALAKGLATTGAGHGAEQSAERGAAVSGAEGEAP
ncbi:F0F1 ATP synthase subunit alpha [Celeribacter neptunius]|uniref:ATP synthase subunit alpha n=1 Tax=Celeribacter neptunius TaxID=588602 RepID=A0A1I3NTV3_9RHOB|nr:F0F1 ATP synthase subunit alpha [Celeribacter neptunius]SFJ12629.1 F-type H+-transporting ATPase subunit alpha [Celeribacter neptunius]